MQHRRYKRIKLSKKGMIAIALAVVVLVGALVAIIISASLGAKPEKALTVVVNDTENNIQTVYRFKTNKTYLSDALLAQKLIVGHEEDDKYVIERVDGKKAEPVKYQCWAIHVNGERGEQDASKIKVADGDSIELRLEYTQ